MSSKSLVNKVGSVEESVDVLLSTPDSSKPNFSPGETSRKIGKRKYVFVCGMPRSGTTIVAREVARLPNCTGFENTGVMMDEGQYLQDVYPTEWACGGAGRFGFAPEAHLTEDSSLLTPTNVARLHQGWEAHWDGDKAIRVEKTPGNLLKTRFLQAAFPDAYFVVIKRHPVPVSLATQKWSLTPLHELFTHWLQCHRVFEEDKKQLNRLYELSYEDYIENPRRYLEEIANFIGTELLDSSEVQAAGGYNQKYFDRWARMLRSSAFKAYYRCVTKDYEQNFREHGYLLAPASSKTTLPPYDYKFVGSILASLLYLGADVCFAFWRVGRELRIRLQNAAVIIKPLNVSLKRGAQKGNS